MACISRLGNLAKLRGSVFTLTRNLNTVQNVPSKFNLIPATLSLAHVDNSWIYQQKDKIKMPVISKIPIIDLPNTLKWIPPPLEKQNVKIIEEPTTNELNTPKEAVRLIVIRRKKMKKHKLKKLRKRMRYEWAKLRQRRELKKEKAFQAGLIEQIKAAEAFSAEQYVQSRLDKLNEVIIPRFWKGKRLPEFIIREKMGLPPAPKTKPSS